MEINILAAIKALGIGFIGLGLFIGAIGTQVNHLEKRIEKLERELNYSRNKHD